MIPYGESFEGLLYWLAFALLAIIVVGLIIERLVNFWWDRRR